MGIKGLMRLISDHAGKAVKEQQMANYLGLKVAIDASMSLYQFLIQIRSGPEGEVLTNEAGEVTSHLQGMFYRTIALLDKGIKPVFVFDGKPPQLKGGELDKRYVKRDDAELELKQAEEDENQEEINKYKKRLVKVTPEHNEETRRLLRLMGVPIVEAPSEAEAQCAEMAKNDLVYGVATEDMDALTFGTPRLLRHLTSPASRKEPILEIDLKTVLEELNMNMEQFIDLCILCGCDYASSIRGIGPHTALKLMNTHGSIEQALKHIDKEKFKVDEKFLYKESAELFRNPEVTPAAEIKLEWRDADEEGLIQFLVNEKGFNLERVQGALKRLKGARAKSSQQRLEGFFKPAAAAVKSEASSSSSSSSGEPPVGIVYEKPNALKRKKEMEAKSKKATGLQKRQKTAASKKKK